MTLLDALQNGDPLDETQIADFLFKERSDEEREALLRALNARGWSGDELGMFAKALAQKARPLPLSGGMDLCGTGGSGLDRINTSTLSGFVVSSLGVPVIKHGNRAASGRFGSFDLIEAMGLPLETDTDIAAYAHWKTGLAFAFAPAFHPAIGAFGPARKALGAPTIFNRLGPLLNPANPDLQLIGTSYPGEAETMARAARAQGKRHILTVRGDDGLDEITITGESEAWLVEGDALHKRTFTPADFGVEAAPLEAILVAGRDAKIAAAHAILCAENKGAMRDLVAVNAGAALWLAKKATSVQDGYQQAVDALTSGAVLAHIGRYADAVTAPTILTRIIGRKAQEIRALWLPDIDIPASERSFAQALATPGLSIIAEVKQKSPSAGDIVAPDAFDPAALARQYEDAGASAISVLIDRDFFGGSLAHLAQVRAAVDVPLLAKEFIIDERQIYATRAAGADAILLIAGVLDTAQINALIRTARTLGMDVLVEAHNAQELQIALASNASIIGINNRDLKHFTVDLERGARLIEALPEADRARILWVGESGIKEPEDVRALPLMANALLVGQGVATDPAKVAALKDARPIVKICGVTRLEDVHTCEAMGVDLIGFNFVPSSKRYLPPHEAAPLIQATRKAMRVGVFVDTAIDEINALADRLALDAVQLSGHEGIDAVYKANRPVIKGVRYTGPEALETAKAFHEAGAIILFEHAEPGSGQSVPLEALWSLPFRFWLAGGLTPENVAMKYRKACAYGVDVASGVETDGRKDARKIEEFVRHARR